MICVSQFFILLIGFSDTSPEELRIEAYKHKEAGNLQPYVSEKTVRVL